MLLLLIIIPRKLFSQLSATEFNSVQTTCRLVYAVHLLISGYSDVRYCTIPNTKPAAQILHGERQEGIKKIRTTRDKRGLKLLTLEVNREHLAISRPLFQD